MFAKLEQRLGYTFRDAKLLKLALTHRSLTNETDETEHNERLEFLGDTIVDFVLADLLYRSDPNADEGELSQLRASAVNQAALAAKARHFRLGELLRMGEGERKSGGSKKDSLLADTYEAVVAAIFLDGGADAAFNFVRNAFVDDVPRLALNDPKTDLQHYAQKKYGSLPSYRIVREWGPEHSRSFTCEVAVENRVMGTGDGKSKRLAEIAAAKAALTQTLSSKDDH